MQELVHVSRTAEECGVPGLSLHLDFVSEAEEQARRWTVSYPEKNMSCLRSPCHSMRRHRRARVQHSCDVFYVSFMCDRTAVSQCGVSASHAITNRGVPDPSSAPLQELLAALDEGPWESLARRRVKHYGFEFRYLTRDVDPGAPIEPIPPSVDALLAGLRAAGATDRLDQLTVNEYEAGVGLSPHIDTHSAFTGESLLKPPALWKLPAKVAAPVSWGNLYQIDMLNGLCCD